MLKLDIGQDGKKGVGASTHVLACIANARDQRIIPTCSLLFAEQHVTGIRLFIIIIFYLNKMNDEFV